MPPKMDLTGHRFGRLEAELEAGRDKWGAVMWRCRCDCGGTVVARASTLRSGHPRSCGCAFSENHPASHRMTRTPLYRRWRSMLDRVDRPEIHTNHGGRGISVCERWRSFEAFASDMGRSFSIGLELERIDNDGDYEPANCRWATHREQNRNKRTNHRLTAAGETLTIVEWGERLGIKPNTILTRVRRGWSVERALELANA